MHSLLLATAFAVSAIADNVEARKNTSCVMKSSAGIPRDATTIPSGTQESIYCDCGGKTVPAKTSKDANGKTLSLCPRNLADAERMDFGQAKNINTADASNDTAVRNKPDSINVAGLASAVGSAVSEYLTTCTSSGQTVKPTAIMKPSGQATNIGRYSLPTGHPSPHVSSATDSMTTSVTSSTAMDKTGGTPSTGSATTSTSTGRATNAAARRHGLDQKYIWPVLGMGAVIAAL